MDFGLKDNVILITGAASGIGHAAARLLKTSGAKLVLTDINAEGLSAVVGEIAAVGLETLKLQLDVSSAEQTKTVVAQAADKFGRIDGLLHFAGVIDAHSIEDTTVTHWNRVININLLGTFLMAQAVAAVMRRQRRGRIVLTASEFGAQRGLDQRAGLCGIERRRHRVDARSRHEARPVRYRCERDLSGHRPHPDGDQGCRHWTSGHR